MISGTRGITGYREFLPGGYVRGYSFGRTFRFHEDPKVIAKM